MSVSSSRVKNLQPNLKMSDEEWLVRKNLAACYRLFVYYGWTDLIYTHLSARVPGEIDQYLINPYGLLFHEITASNLIKVDFNGNVLSGDFPYNDAGHAIHTAVLKARSDVNVVLHSHTRAGMAVSCMQEGLLPLTQQAGEIAHLVCYHKYGLADENNPEECRRLGEDIADKWLMVMHNHGLLAAGRSVAEAFYLLYTLENACKVQVDVMQSTSDIIFPDKQAIADLAEYTDFGSDEPADHVTRSWDALMRMLDEKQPSYRN